VIVSLIRRELGVSESTCPYFKHLNLLKREFFASRVLWRALFDRVSVLDEMAMFVAETFFLFCDKFFLFAPAGAQLGFSCVQPACTLLKPRHEHLCFLPK
jgi:hypothetical protein